MTRTGWNPIVLGLAAAIVAAACRDDPIVAPRALHPQAAGRNVSVSGGTAFMLSAEVHSDVFKVLYYNVPLDANGASTASLTLPADVALKITLRAHNQYGEATHQGDLSIGPLVVGSNGTTSATLAPIATGQVLTVSVDIVGERAPEGIAQLVFRPAATSVSEGQELSLGVPYGVQWSGSREKLDPSVIHWAVSDPRAGRIIVRKGGAFLLATNAHFTTTVMASYGTAFGTFRPTLTLDPYVDVSAGQSHTCALRQSGAIFCWGFNALGQLGSPLKECDPTYYCQERPTLVSGGKIWQSLSVGDEHTCAIDTNLQAFCWGNGNDYRLGSGAAVGGGYANPTPLPVDGGRSYRAISAGLYHTCAIEELTLAGWCWGSQLYGALGNGVADNLPALPAQVSGGHHWYYINASAFFTCAVDWNFDAWCWGSNSLKQLGHPNANPNPLSPQRDAVPVLTDNTRNSLELSKGVMGATCVEGDDYQSYCWGNNADGMTGIGSAAATVAVPTAILGPVPNLGALTSGYGHSCGIGYGSVAYCWGSNYKGELGDNTTVASRSIPTAVATSLTFRAITAGGGHTCAVTVDGDVYCWGDGWMGKLGNGTRGIDSAAPVKVAQ